MLVFLTGFIIQSVGLALLVLSGLTWFWLRPKRPNVTQPKQMCAETLSFEFPRNWKVELGHDMVPVWTIDATGSGMLVIQAMERDDQVPFDEWTADFCHTFREAFDEQPVTQTKLIGRENGILEPTSVTIAGVDVPGIRHEFEVRALDEVDLHRAEFFALQDERVFVYVVTYVEPTELPVLGPGFDLVLGSLRNGSGKPFAPLET